MINSRLELLLLCECNIIYFTTYQQPDVDYIALSITNDSVKLIPHQLNGCLSLSLIVFWTSLISDGYKLIDTAEIIYFKQCHNRFRCITILFVFLGIMVSYSNIFDLDKHFIYLLISTSSTTAYHHLIILDYRNIPMVEYWSGSFILYWFYLDTRGPVVVSGQIK